MIGPHIIKNTLSYIAGIIFLISIGIYIYLLIEDNRDKTKHTEAESFWIYLLLIILILGFFVSYHFISRSNERIMKEHFQKKSTLHFTGQNPRIPVGGGGPLRNF